MSPEILIILMLVMMVVGVFSGAPIAIVLGVVSLVTGLLAVGPRILPIFIIRIWGVMQNHVLVAVPLFVFMGFIFERAGVAEELYSAMEDLFRRVRGGLALGTIVFTTLLATCTGIVATSVVAAGALALPAMFRRNYNKELAMGSVAAGGTLGILIPPSIMLVFYGAESGLSVGRLFLAAVTPGLLLSTLYMSYIALRCHVQPELAPLPQREQGTRSPIRKLIKLAKGLLPISGVILSILGVIIFGIATPTEAAGAGVVGALIVAAFYKRLTWAVVKYACLKAVEVVGMAMLIIAGALCFASIFLAVGGDDVIVGIVEGLAFGPYGLVIFVLVIVFMLGMFIDWVGILYICMPVFLPIIRTAGIDELWFALLVCVTLQTAWLTPPFGFSLFFLKGITPPDITFASIIRGCAPFVGVQILCVILLLVFPTIVTWLPSLVWS